MPGKEVYKFKLKEEKKSLHLMLFFIKFFTRQRKRNDILKKVHIFRTIRMLNSLNFHPVSIITNILTFTNSTYILDSLIGKTNRNHGPTG